MQRDKIYGLLILLVALILLVYLSAANLMVIFSGGNRDFYITNTVGALKPFHWLFFGPWTYVVLPLLLAEVLIFGIAAWIGWTMLTTPPPVPLEELEGLGLDDEEEKSD